MTDDEKTCDTCMWQSQPQVGIKQNVTRCENKKNKLRIVFLKPGIPVWRSKCGKKHKLWGPVK